MCRSILSLSKIAHLMLHDHPVTQGNRRRQHWGWGLELTGKCVHACVCVCVCVCVGGGNLKKGEG